MVVKYRREPFSRADSFLFLIVLVEGTKFISKSFLSTDLLLRHRVNLLVPFNINLFFHIQRNNKNLAAIINETVSDRKTNSHHLVNQSNLEDLRQKSNFIFHLHTAISIRLRTTSQFASPLWATQKSDSMKKRFWLVADVEKLLSLDGVWKKKETKRKETYKKKYSRNVRKHRDDRGRVERKRENWWNTSYVNL